jgi:hypothetical protein
MCFIVINRPINFTFDFIYPFVLNKITVNRTKCQVLFFMRAESIAAFKCGLDKALCTSAGSSVINKFPYRIVEV